MADVKFDSKVSWAVAVTCSLLNFLVLIPTKVSGLFFVEILDRYNVSRNLAGYAAFTITLMRCSGGPFAGYLAERFGMNEVMTLGSLLAAVGISACFFAEDIIAVTVLLGLIHGIGVSFTNTFFAQIVTIHFRKHITLGFGIAQAGACLGSFLSPPVLLWIFRSYSTSGGFLIIGAIILNGLPIVLILNILSPNKFYKTDESGKSKTCPERHSDVGLTTAVNSKRKDANITNNFGNRKESDMKTRDGIADSEVRNSLDDKTIAVLALNTPGCDHGEITPARTDGLAANITEKLNTYNLSTIETGSGTGKDRAELVLAECEMISEVKTKNPIHDEKTKVAAGEKIGEMQSEFKGGSVPAKLKTNFDKTLLQSDDCTHSKIEYKLKSQISNKNLLKSQAEEMKDCYPSSKTPSYTSVNNMTASINLGDQEKPHQIENGEYISTSFNALRERSLESIGPSNQKMNQKEGLKIDKKPSTGTKSAKKPLEIFLDITFWPVMMTQSIYVFILVIFWTTMIDFSRDKKIDRSKEVYLLMALPIAEMIGRLGLGWITDRKYLTRINFCIVSFIVMGCSCSLMAWAEEFVVVMISIIMFGVLSSGLTTAFPAIIFEFFDSTKQTMGQASRFCLFGPLSFLNGPLIGYFRGTLGSYVWLYHTLAMMSAVSAALSALIPLLARKRDKKKNIRI